jgi:hypothetical protein
MTRQERDEWRALLEAQARRLTRSQQGTLSSVIQEYELGPGDPAEPSYATVARTAAGTEDRVKLMRPDEKFEVIARQAIEAAERVECSFSDFIGGLDAIKNEINERLSQAREEREPRES